MPPFDLFSAPPAALPSPPQERRDPLARFSGRPDLGVDHRVKIAAPPPRLHAQELQHLRTRLERVQAQQWGVAPLGDGRLDSCFPAGGLARGRWHEITGAGGERETPAAATGFCASLARACAGDGFIFWALQRDDAHAPGLQSFGLDLDRLIFVRGANDADVLAIVEDALRTRGVSAAIGEVTSPSLVASKRLQLACETGGATGFLLQRALYGAARTRRVEASAATTRWRITSAPSVTDEPGLGSPRWRVALERCRGGRTGAWIMESDDETGHVRVVAELADHAAETGDGRGAASWPSGVRNGRYGGECAALGGG